MAAQDRPTNKARFEQGDTPQGSDYADLIDSFVSLTDTTAQSIASNLTVPTLIATTVSAATVNVATVSASSVFVDGSFRGATITLSGNVSANSANITTNVSASSGHFETLWVGGNMIEGSEAKSVGVLYLIATASTVVTTAGSFFVMAGETTTDSTLNQNFTMPQNGRLRYVGATQRKFHAQGFMTMTAIGNNKLTAITIAKNNTPITGAEIERDIGTGTQRGALSVGAMVSLVSGDYLEVQGTNKTDATNIVAEKLQFTVVEV